MGRSSKNQQSVGQSITTPIQSGNTTNKESIAMFKKTAVSVSSTTPITAAAISNVSTDTLLEKYPQFVQTVRAEAIRFDFNGVTTGDVNGADLTIPAFARQAGRALAMIEVLKPTLVVSEEAWDTGYLTFVWQGVERSIGVRPDAVPQTDKEGNPILNKDGEQIARTRFGHYVVENGVFGEKINAGEFNRQPYIGLANTLILTGQVEADRMQIRQRGELVHGWNDVLGRIVYRRPYPTEWQSAYWFLLHDMINEATGGEVVLPHAFLGEYALESDALAEGYNTAFAYYTKSMVACQK